MYNSAVGSGSCQRRNSSPQLYMFFMTWRYQKLLEHYTSMKPSYGGECFIDRPPLLVIDEPLFTGYYAA